MEYRILGRTGIRVSAVGIGGEGFEKKDYAACEAIVDTAIGAGINCFDLFNSNPDVRTNVGRALRRYPRESYVIEGHFCTTWDNGQYRRTRDIGEVRASYEDLLARLGTEYIDIGMFHYVDDHADFAGIIGGEIMCYAQELKAKGVVRCIGLSTHNPEIALAAVESGLIDVIMFSINPAYDMLPVIEDVYELFEAHTYQDRTYAGIDPQRDALYRACANAGVALTVMKAYAAGVLLDAKQSPFGLALTPVQCLAYCLDRPGVAAVMVGVGSPEQVLAAAAYATASAAERDYTTVLAQAPRTDFSGHCMYCGHCAPCPQSIDIAAVNKYLDLAQIQDAVPDTLRSHYELLGPTAGACVECGVCQTNCPFGVKIIERMRAAAALFGR